VRYQQDPTKKDANLAFTQQLQGLAHTHPNFGYRHITALLKRQGHQANAKRVQRLWKLCGLSLPRRRPKKRHCRPEHRLVEQATRPNQLWCYDFVHDRCANGVALKMLTMEDEFTRESLAIEVGGSLPSARVLLGLEQLFEQGKRTRFYWVFAVGLAFGALKYLAKAACPPARTGSHKLQAARAFAGKPQ
jgi:transposase InsO family protein